MAYDTDTDQLSRTTGRLSYGKHRAKMVAEDAAGSRVTMTRSFRVIRGR